MRVAKRRERRKSPLWEVDRVLPTLAHPWFLLLLLLIPPLMWWWYQQRRGALRYPGIRWLTLLPRRRGRWARWGGVGLRTSALILLVVALSGPRWPDRRTRIQTEGIAIVMVVDVSGSMAEQDFSWKGLPIQRLEAVKRIFRLFVVGGQGNQGEEVPLETPDDSDPAQFPGRRTDLIGLVTFAARPMTTCPLTLSHSVPIQLLQKEQPYRVTGESETNLSDAVVLGLHRLQSAGTRRKVMVLLSDGEHNVVQPRSGWTPQQTAQLAVSLGVPIYSIQATPLIAEGETDGALHGKETLENLARISGGQSFSARSSTELLEVCQQIDQLERSPIQSFQYRRYHEAYPWFALGALVLLTLASTLERTIWRRVP